MTSKNSKNRRFFPSAALSAGEKGQGLVEYALILVLVAIIVIAILMLLGPTVGAVFSEVTDALLNMGRPHPITGVSVTRNGMSVHVFVTVAESTTVTVTLPGETPKTETFSGTYEFVFGGIGGSGTGTAIAEGRSKSFDYPAP